MAVGLERTRVHTGSRWCCCCFHKLCLGGRGEAHIGHRSVLLGACARSSVPVSTCSCMGRRESPENHSPGLSRPIDSPSLITLSESIARSGVNTFFGIHLPYRWTERNNSCIPCLENRASKLIHKDISLTLQKKMLTSTSVLGSYSQQQLKAPNFQYTPLPDSAPFSEPVQVPFTHLKQRQIFSCVQHTLGGSCTVNEEKHSSETSFLLHAIAALCSANWGHRPLVHHLPCL